MISVAISSISPTNLERCIDSLYKSEYREFELVVNNAIESEDISRVAHKFRATEINKKTNILESWLRMIDVCEGDYIFLLSDSRVVSSTLLELISKSRADMLIIGENEVGSGLIPKIYNLERKGMSKVPTNNLNPYTLRSILPRVYKSNLLKLARANIIKNLGDKMISRVWTLDQEIIYFEVFQLSRNVEFIRSAEIQHTPEESIVELWKKYFKYGRGQKALKNTAYSTMTTMHGRTRNGLPIFSRLLSVPSMILRAPPYILGYINGDQ